MKQGVSEMEEQVELILQKLEELEKQVFLLSKKIDNSKQKELFTTEEASYYLGISPQNFRYLKSTDRIPLYVKPVYFGDSEKGARYRKGDLNRWICQLQRKS